MTLPSAAEQVFGSNANASNVDATTPASAAAKLDQLLADPKYRARYLSGDGPFVKEVHGLISKKVGEEAAADAKLDRIVAGVESVPIFETTVGGELSTYNLLQGAQDLKTMGLDDAIVKEALAGKPLPRALHEQTKQRRSDRCSDQEWVKRYQGGDRAAKREMLLMNIIIARGIADEAA